MIVRWVVGTALATFALLCIAINFASVVQWSVSGKRSSGLPLMGGLSGLFAVLVLPLHMARWCWVPLLLDLSWPLAVKSMIVNKMTRSAARE